MTGLLSNKSRPRPRSWTASVNCWDWPVADCVCSFQKGGALCSKTTEPYPNELAGSEVRPQPPHCDKNSYIFESPPFQCYVDDKAPTRYRQPVKFCRR
jgi:hypothetical protein